jgi:hypothetical protein
MFAQPENSGIAIAVARDLTVPDPTKAVAMEVLNGNTRSDRNDSEGGEQSR